MSELMTDVSVAYGTIPQQQSLHIDDRASGPETPASSGSAMLAAETVEALRWLEDYAACLIGGHGDFWQARAKQITTLGYGHWWDWRSWRQASARLF